MFLREDKLLIERIMNTEETFNNDWLEVNLSKMIQINCQAMESLEEASKQRQKLYNLGKVEDLLVVGESVRVKKSSDRQKKLRRLMDYRRMEG